MHDTATRTSKWPRYARLSGVVFTVLALLSVLMQKDSPGFLAKADEIAAYYTKNAGQALGSGTMSLLAVAFLLWFLGVLYSHLRHHEGASHAGDHGRLSHTALAGGAVGSAMMLAGSAASMVAALRADENGSIDPAIAATLYDLSLVLPGLAAPYGMAVLLLACALLSFKVGALPKWLGILSIVISIGLLVPGVNHMVMIAFVFWVAIVSIVLFLGHHGDHEHDRPVAVAAP